MKGLQIPVFNFSIKNQAGSSVDIFIDGEIVDAPTQSFLKDYFGDDTTTSYKSFRDILNKIDASVYNIYINSIGGQVTEAMAIHDLLGDMQANGKVVNTIGRGLIASSATYILMAGNSSMSNNSWGMIHNVSGFCYGDVNQVETYAATMRKFNDAANSFYQKATGLSKTVIGNMMDAETWMTAEEMKEKGFVKNITAEANFTNSIKPEQWLFNNTSVLNSYNSFTQKNNPIMDTNKITETIQNGFNSLMEKLGIANKKEEQPVQDAFKDFTESITNSIKEGMAAIVVPDNAAITLMVTEAVANSFKTLPENFTQAIMDANKDNVKTADLEKLLNKADFKIQMDAFTNSVIAKLGAPTNAEHTEDKPKPAAKKTTNKFSGFFEQYN